MCSNGDVGRGILVALLLVLGPRLASASVEVSHQGARVSVQAEAAPLSEVLDRLSRELGMKVVYEGGAPRNLVNASLVNRTPAEAVLSVLEGLGLDYLARMDATGARIEHLVIVRPVATASASVPDTAAARPRPVARDEEAVDEEDVPLTSKPSRQARPPAPNPGLQTQDRPNATPAGPPPAPAANPPMTYPVSPFAPAAPVPPMLAPPPPASPSEDTGDENPDEQ